MRSAHADAFNHDDDADGYDSDVLDETHPIRAGYDALLSWLAAFVTPSTQARLLDLGTGTGNLVLRLPRLGAIDCVDISKNMLSIARDKFRALPAVNFFNMDLLQFFETQRPAYDWVSSSYAIHHLTDDEKGHLFARVYGALKPGGSALLGDLMFENRLSRAAYLSHLRAKSLGVLADEIEEEFFWDLDEASARLGALGFRIQVRRFSDLTFGILASKAQ